MIRIFSSLCMLGLLVFFTLRWSVLDMWASVLIFLLLSLYFAFGSINYLYAKKMILVDGVFRQNGLLRGVLSGKFISLLRSFILGLVLSFVTLFNLLHIDKFSFLYVFIASLLIFLAVKFLLHFLFLKEFKNSEFMRIFDVSFAAILLSFLSIFLPHSENLAQSVTANFELLRELYSFKVLLADFSHFLSLKFYIFNLIFALNEFGFYFAICYFFSIIFDFKIAKFGYFITTLLALSYVLGFSYLSLNLKPKQSLQTTRVDKIARFIINLETNSSIDITSIQAREIKSSINNYQNITINEIKNYLEQSFEAGSKVVAREFADFYFGVFTDYVILFHSIAGDEKKYMQNIIQNAINKGFGNDMNNKIVNIIDDNFSSLNKEILQKISSHTDINELNLKEHFGFLGLADKKLRASASAGVGFGSMILAKITTKSLAKFGSKLAASGTAAGSGVACGAFAPFCSIAFAGATWVGFDVIFASGDEMLNRAKFEDQIQAILMQEKDEIFNNIKHELLKSYEIIRSGVVD